MIPHSRAQSSECEHSGDKSATRGLHGSLGKQGEPGEEQEDNKLGSHIEPET